MSIIYNFIASVAWFFIKLSTLWNPKLSLFVKGRTKTFDILQNKIQKTDKVIWVHAASLGEYEQGLPVMENLKQEFPKYKILLTFFSPSGYEVKKNTKVADVITYLPFDTKKKAKLFLDTVRPDMALFIKYEIWPNYLKELKKRGISVLLISALFKKNQIFFKAYGGFMRTALTAFSHFYVQDENSKNLLKSIHIGNCTVTGDTRLDRVSEILTRDNSLDFMTKFKQTEFCVVAGSTWPPDEKLLIEYINTSKHNLKFIIAPHNIKGDHILSLKKSINKSVIVYSELQDEDLSDFQVLIVDTIGLLTKIYSYADIAYVGGAFGTGLHNTLEPAVFGIPVLIGPQYNGFIEAEKLVELGGIISVTDEKNFYEVLDRLHNNEEFREKTGRISCDYILNNKGASIQIMSGIRKLL